MLRSSLKKKNTCIAAVCLSGTRYQQQGGDWRGGGNFDCANGIRVDTVINRTDKTFSASKTVLSHILWSQQHL